MRFGNSNAMARGLWFTALAVFVVGLQAEERSISLTKGCKLALLAKGRITGALVIKDGTGKKLAELTKPGETFPLTLDGNGYVSRKLEFSGATFEYDLKFSFDDNVNYACRIGSKLMGDKIEVKNEKWDGLMTKQGKTRVSTNPGTTLLTISLR